jgi:prepilin-type N-terminal cleavage/methylation domain-containing protein
MMISPIGKRSCGMRGVSSKRGLSFLEVMVTAVILSVGMVAIYRSFFITMDHLQYLSCRLYANNLIETKIAHAEKDFRDLQDFDIGSMTEEVEIGNKEVVFSYTMDLKPVGTLLSVFQLDITLSWEDRGRTVSISRAAYFSGVTPLEKGG